MIINIEIDSIFCYTIFRLRIGVAFGYFVWKSTTNTDISFTVSGAVVQLDDDSDVLFV